MRVVSQVVKLKISNGLRFGFQTELANQCINLKIELGGTSGCS